MDLLNRFLRPVLGSVRARLALIQALLFLSLLLISLIAWRAISDERASGTKLAQLSRAERYEMSADSMREALESDVNQALRVDLQDTEDLAKVLATAHENYTLLAADLTALADLDLPPAVGKKLAENSQIAKGYATLAVKMVTTAVHDRAQALHLYPEFTATFDALGDVNEESAALLDKEVAAAETNTIREAASAHKLIVVCSIVTVLIVCLLVALIGRSIRISLGKVRDAARALAAGNLSVRSEVASLDEVGELAGAVNKMADELQVTIGRLLADADRDAFSAKITQALEMADSEDDVYGVVSRAMEQISGHPTELLLADANQSSLKRAVTHPTAGAPSCNVESASNCAAVRRAAPVVFEDSESLDACPRLRNRTCGPISAACVPVSFMGRAFGVLHVTASIHKPPAAKQLAQLKTLGLQAGARVGAVRALARTHMHAYTDSLTGLKNRRAFEQQIDELTAGGSAYAVALTDLDKFKSLNDTHGHKAGDEALRLFAEVLKRTIRNADVAARWGGEEFSILFVGASAQKASEIVHRIRAELAESLLTSGTPPFTASFGLSDSSMGSSFGEVLRVADQALYRSKTAGRDRLSIGPAAAESLSEHASERDQASSSSAMAIR